MNRLLEGRVAIVTGAGSGIGRAEAICMAQQGAKVVVNDIGTGTDGQGLSHEPADAVVRQITSVGNVAVANYDSVAVEESAINIIQAAIDNFGRLDILVNNAGILGDRKNIADLSLDDWDPLIKTHLYGTFFCTQRACSHMRDRGYGRIINTSSHTGLGWKGSSAYAAAKEGIAGFTRTVARDMAEFGVTCNAIRPLAVWRGRKNIPSENIAKNRPEDVASLVVYLASKQADNINGCIFEVWRGHVGIFKEPPPVENAIDKEGTWTPQDLVEVIPQTLTKNRSRDLEPFILKLD
jgi:NAD(P)-dependent dehydrogenase (short-subunit alcohol dehydrogenase family)